MTLSTKELTAKVEELEARVAALEATGGPGGVPDHALLDLLIEHYRTKEAEGGRAPLLAALRKLRGEEEEGDDNTDNTAGDGGKGE